MFVQNISLLQHQTQTNLIFNQDILTHKSETSAFYHFFALANNTHCH